MEKLKEQLRNVMKKKIGKMKGEKIINIGGFRKEINFISQALALAAGQSYEGSMTNFL